MDRKAPLPDTVADTANADRARSGDLLVMLGKILRAIANALDDKLLGSLSAQRLLSVVSFFIRALLRALRDDQRGSRPRSRATATIDRALVAPASRWAAP